MLLISKILIATQTFLLYSIHGNLSVGFFFAMLSPAQTAIEEKTPVNESIVPAKRATLPLAKDTFPLRIPSALEQ